MLPNLRLVLFIVYLIITNFKKILIRNLVISNIIVYYTTIILNIMNKVTDYIKLRVAKSWLI